MKNRLLKDVINPNDKTIYIPNSLINLETVRQSKNILTLLLITELSNFDKNIKKTDITFTLSDYAHYRGYGNKNIDNKIRARFIKDVEACSNIYYSLTKLKTSTYSIKWINPYKLDIYEILTKNSKSYVSYPYSTFRDITSDNKAHFYWFLLYIFKSKSFKNPTFKKIQCIDLFKFFKINNETILNSPSYCYNQLIKTISICKKLYPDLFCNTYIIDYKSRGNIEIDMGLLDSKKIQYKEFKHIYNIEDIRKVYIEFMFKVDEKRIEKDKQKFINKIYRLCRLKNISIAPELKNNMNMLELTKLYFIYRKSPNIKVFKHNLSKEIKNYLI